jgi:hypothetical protein
MTTGSFPRPDPDELGIDLAEVDDAPPPMPTAYTTAEQRRRALVESAPTAVLPTWEELHAGRHRTAPMPRVDVPGAFPVASEPMPRPAEWHVTPTDIQDSEWGRRIEEKVNAADARWKWTRRALTALGPVAVTSLALALGWLRSSEKAAGVAAEREQQRVEVRAGVIDLQQHVIPDLRAQLAAVAAEMRSLIASNAAAIARLTGALDMLNRLAPDRSGPRRTNRRSEP